jgi:hypothetical protein
MFQGKALSKSLGAKYVECSVEDAKSVSEVFKVAAMYSLVPIPEPPRCGKCVVL